MLRLAEQQLDMLCGLLPDHPPGPKGGRPGTDKRMAIKGMFWILDHGAKWKDLPAEHGTKSSVHRALQRWVEMGAFEAHALQVFVRWTPNAKSHGIARPFSPAALLSGGRASCKLPGVEKIEKEAVRETQNSSLMTQYAPCGVMAAPYFRLINRYS